LTAASIPESVTWKIVCTVPIVVLLSLHTSTLKLALPKSVMRLQSRFGPKESVKSGWSLIMEIDTTMTFRVRSTLYLLDSRPYWDILGALAS
jgi:hypothetical protein